MLAMFRDRHAKKVLWGLLIVIVPAFVLWGGLSSLKERSSNSIGTISGKKITARQFNDYLTKAKVYTSLYGQNQEQIKYEDLVNLSFDLMVLLWKADKDKIVADDQEVVNFVKTNLFGKNAFNQVAYNRFLSMLSRQYNLGLTTRNFEECVRDFLRINKLFANNIDVAINEDEIKAAYNQDTQTAKLSYLFIPDNKFKGNLEILDEEINEFYNANIELFKKVPKVSMRYLIIKRSQITKERESEIQSIAASIDKLAEKFSAEIKQSGPLGLGDPIEGINLKAQVNELVFSAEAGKVIGPIESGNEVIFMEKTKDFPEEVLPLSEVKEQVKEKIVFQRARNGAIAYSKMLIEKINISEHKNMNNFANGEEIVFKETNSFKNGEFVEGLGVNPSINSIAFSLEENSIHSEPIEINDGVCVIQLKELSDFDQEKFDQEKESYSTRIKTTKETLERIKFLFKTKESANLKVF